MKNIQKGIWMQINIREIPVCFGVDMKSKMPVTLGHNLS
jgi:hypothetical protein